MSLGIALVGFEMFIFHHEPVLPAYIFLSARFSVVVVVVILEQESYDSSFLILNGSDLSLFYFNLLVLGSHKLSLE